jgi:hypothetical protein
MSSGSTRLERATAFLLLVSAFSAAPAGAAELHVPDDFPTIQAAIDAAIEDQDTVVIAPDTYTDNFTLKSNIKVRGAETARTILRSTSSAPIMVVNGLEDVDISNLTFSEGDIGIEITGGDDINIFNNVFSLETTSTAIKVTDNSNVGIRYNTFHDNDVAIERATDSTLVKNNIFSSNTTSVDDAGDDADNISFNCFSTGSEKIGSGPVGDPLFVNISALDFHLRQNSPCKDAGDPAEDKDIFDPTSDGDAGAYGGGRADIVAFPVGRPNATVAESATNPGRFDVTLTWSRNLSYLTTSLTDAYRIYYDSDESGEPYDGADAQDSGGSPKISPFEVGNVGTVTLFNLLATPAVPDAPVLQAPSPSNRTLDLRWSAVPGATGYRIEYGIAAVDENEIDVGNVTAYELGGLVNEQVYSVQVSALQQTRYFFALTVLGTTTGDPDDTESKHSPERSIAVGPAQVGTASNIQTGQPQPIEPYPLLPDQGEAGCFIATAAYGHFSHPQVQLLRDFRDRYLLTNVPGSAFVRWYYRHSPAAAAYIAQHETLRMLVRWSLLPAVGLAWLGLHAPAAILALTLLTMIAIFFIFLRRNFQRVQRPG